MIFALALAAAAATPPVASDRYWFEHSTLRQSQVTVNIVRYRSFEAMDADLARQGVTVANGYRIEGYAQYSRGRCTIYILDEAVQYRPEIIGHEMTHCIAGNFHPTQPR